MVPHTREPGQKDQFKFTSQIHITHLTILKIVRTSSCHDPLVGDHDDNDDDDVRC